MCYEFFSVAEHDFSGMRGRGDLPPNARQLLPLPALRSKPKPHVSKVIWCVLPLFLRSAFREMAMFMFDFVVEHRGLPREKSGFGSYFKKVK